MITRTPFAGVGIRPKTWLMSRLSRGVGLIDVLVAMAVLAGGVVGLAKIQSVTLKEGDSSKARSVAIQLATAKLDDLRSFTQAAAGAGGVFGYDEIANNAGGAENANGSLRVPSGAVTVGNVSYTRTWTAQGRYFCLPNAVATTANCAAVVTGAANKPRPDFYALTVNVAWTDADGTARTASLNGSANSNDPLLAAFSLLSITSEGPIVTYNPGDAPAVIAIDTGGGRKIETTNPTPSLVMKGQTVINTIARYETVSYDTSNQTLRRRQFTTINCSCEQAGVGAGEDRFGNPVSKRIGVPSDQFQAFECTVCCRDHHDTSASGNPETSCNPATEAGRKGCYDPYRTSDAVHYPAGLGGDHGHFTANSQPADNVGDVYVEACRLERVDGYLRVAQDWKLEVVNAIPADFFTSANITSYGTYVKSYVASLMSGGSAPSPIWSSSEVVNKNSQRPLLARAIYVDYLDSAQRAAYASRIAANDPQVFQEIPFFEVNMTKLAKWSSTSGSVASVSDEQLVPETAGQDLYSRGLVTGLSAGTTNATAQLRLGNTGVINQFISSDPQEGTQTQSSSVAITVPGTTYTASGTISDLPSGTAVTVTATGTSGSPNVACTSTFNSFTCTLPAAWNGSISASATGYTFTPGSLPISNLGANQSSLNFAALPASGTYTVSGVISPTVADASVSAVGSGTSSNVTCSYTSGSGAYACVLPANWTGTILPASVTSTFTPGSHSYSGPDGITADETVNFTSSTAASSYTISGVVSFRPLVTVTMVASPTTATCSAVANDGSYSCTAPSGWTGTLTPTVAVAQSADITFSPANRSFTNIGSNLSGQDFATYYRISGKVSPNTGTSPVTGVTFAATGSGVNPNGVCSAYDDATGDYACVVPGGWTGFVQPTKASTTFAPTSVTYTGVGSPYTTQNYVATPVATTSYTITVTVTSLKNNQTGVTIAAFSGLSCGSTVASGTGTNRTATIACTVLSGWSGTITPVVPNLSGDVVTPGSTTFTNVTANGTAAFSVVP